MARELWTPHKNALKGAQERHQRRVVSPVPFRLVVGDFAPCQSPGFHLQIDFRVNVRRIQRNMPEPGANGIDIHTGAEQMCGRRMSNAVRANPLCHQRGHLGLEAARVTFHQGVNAEASYGMSATIEKCTRCRRTIYDERLKFLNGTGPERAEPLFAAFPTNFDRATQEI